MIAPASEQVARQFAMTNSALAMTNSVFALAYGNAVRFASFDTVHEYELQRSHLSSSHL
jgi:hypothetical protein